MSHRGRTQGSKRIGNLQVVWANASSSDLSPEEISMAVALIRKLSQRIH
jgi:hypothetical protein